MSDTLLTLRVAEKRPLAEDICAFELEAVDGAALPPFAAGAHIDVHVPAGPGRAQVVRPYSLCGPPGAARTWQIAVLREPASRGGSVALHERVGAGSLLQVGLPRNHFPLATGVPHSLLLAGGIGITPLLAMAEQLARDSASFELHLAARSAARVPFHDRLAAATYAARVQLHLDDGAPAQRLDIAATLATQPVGAHLYVCGPQGFMDAVLGAARSTGWAEARLHWEFFGADVQAQTGDREFDVVLARSGRTIRVGVDQTVVRALEDARVILPTSCEQGVCGTCLTRVLEGIPDHRDHYLTPEEQAANDQFTPCCSRARSARLVLDL